MGPEDPTSKQIVVEANQDSFSLDPKLRVMRSISSLKLRLVNYLNKTDTPGGEESRFGSCNEFTLGINQNQRRPIVEDSKACET